MNIKVIQNIKTGEFLEDYDYFEDYFIERCHTTKDISKAMVFRNTFYAIDVMRMLGGSGLNYRFKNIEYTNL